MTARLLPDGRVRLATGEVVDEDTLDWADRAVNFGGYRAYQFSPKWPHNGTPLPRKPRPAEGTCLCEACRSEGWYAVSPVCRYWRAHCEVCSGRRLYMTFPGRVVVACEVCQEQWTKDVRFFMEAIEHPRRVAARLRQENLAQAVPRLTRDIDLWERMAVEDADPATRDRCARLAADARAALARLTNDPARYLPGRASTGEEVPADA